MSDEITRLPVKFKEPPSEERTLEIVQRWGAGSCNHDFYFAGDPLTGASVMKNVTYIVSEAEAEVTCGHCKAKLNPTWVLVRLAHQETKYHETAKRYQEEMKRLSERQRTKCDRCGHMTRISRR
jgi:Zn finger protein HypA/HybF involved in hydrogenase expression